MKSLKPEIVQFERLKPYASRAAKEQVSLKDSSNTVWWAIFNSQGIVIACGGVYVKGHKARFKGMWTDPSARGQGLGTAILQAGYDWCSDRMDISLLEAYSVNPPIWERYGFRRTGKLPNGAVIMTKANG